MEDKRDVNNDIKLLESELKLLDNDFKNTALSLKCSAKLNKLFELKEAMLK